MSHDLLAESPTQPVENAGFDGDFATAFAGAMAQHRAGNLQAAQDGYLRLVALAPDTDAAARVLVNLGALLKARGCLDQAIEIYQQSIALTPDNPTAYCNLANIFAQRNQADKAEVCYRQAIRLDGTSGEAHHGLAVLLNQHGERATAAKLLELATRLAPDYPDSWFTWGTLLDEDGEPDRAIECFARYLVLDPQDACGATIQLSRLGAIDAPANAPHRHLIEYYQSRATDWDRNARRPGTYGGLDALRRIVVEIAPTNRFATVLDIGCGTGLCGEFLRPLADTLEGVDLSPPMLARARAKTLYDEVRRGDLIKDLAAHPASYDLIVGAAVLIHFGDLAPVFRAAYTALRRGGIFAFTLFKEETETYVPTTTSFFAHGRSYVAAQSQTASLAIRRLDDIVHEYHDGRPRPGLVVALERPSAAA